MNKSFEDYYHSLYKERWGFLREALLAPNDAVAFDGGGILAKPYYMDSASALAAEQLQLPESGEVLDACAAPGGKTLALASRIGADCWIVANDLSSDRRRRLASVLDEHLPPDIRARVKVSGFDAAAAGGRKKERGRFAAVLLDAPCSSERHVLADEVEYAKWTPARPKYLAARQWALLSSCFLLLAPGGCLVYCTCALAPEENGGVMARLFAKYGGEAESVPPDFEAGEPTDYGRIILPDRSGGAGPLYVARVRKKSD
jgi:16S rRNA (cytosine1407-C5)-methyltransferase